MQPSPSFEITRNGEAKWLNEQAGPTQTQLRTFLSHNRQNITHLDVSVEHGKTQPILNFETIATLPSLKSLVLSGVFVEALAFTTANTPVLQSLNISLLSCSSDEGLRFELALPCLKSFSAQHVMINGRSDFGLSLSRCPMLEKVYTYKFRFLSGDSFVILPNCQQLTLYRSEGTDCLEVLSAPKLTTLSVESSYSLNHVRLWDLRNEILVQDVEKIAGDLLAASKTIGEELNEWAKKWKDGTFTGMDAYERNWIEWEEVDGFDFNTHQYMDVILHDNLDRLFRKQRQAVKERIWKQFIADISKRAVVNRKKDLPKCEINCVNVSLSKSTRDHLMANKRVSLVGLDDDDDDDGMFMPFFRI